MHCDRPHSRILVELVGGKSGIMSTTLKHLSHWRAIVLIGLVGSLAGVMSVLLAQPHSPEEPKERVVVLPDGVRVTIPPGFTADSRLDADGTRHVVIEKGSDPRSLTSFVEWDYSVKPPKIVKNAAADADASEFANIAQQMKATPPEGGRFAMVPKPNEIWIAPPPGPEPPVEAPEPGIPSPDSPALATDKWRDIVIKDYTVQLPPGFVYVEGVEALCAATDDGSTADGCVGSASYFGHRASGGIVWFDPSTGRILSEKIPVDDRDEFAALKQGLEEAFGRR